MLRKRLIACLLVPAFGATMPQPAAAEEPTGTRPPARSIREWNPNGPPPAVEPVPTSRPAQSIREWRASTAVPAMAPCPTSAPIAPTAIAAATPAAKRPAAPAVRGSSQKTPITISIKSALRKGNLVIELDGVPVFNEEFRKPLLFVSQTTTWDPLQVAAGPHRLSAKVYGAKKTYHSATYDLEVSRSKASALRFVMQGDKLTVELAS